MLKPMSAIMTGFVSQVLILQMLPSKYFNLTITLQPRKLELLTPYSVI